MNDEKEEKEIIPLKTENKKAAFSSTQTIWLIVFSVIAALIYTYVNIS
ncbi:MAG: hypothetical protein U9R32_01270 [Bacteroidota bacterium]|nr:hypothetical protein [Bacteroidota bacterium]